MVGGASPVVRGGNMNTVNPHHGAILYFFYLLDL
jgi:hypothetical protein